MSDRARVENGWPGMISRSAEKPDATETTCKRPAKSIRGLTPQVKKQAATEPSEAAIGVSDEDAAVAVVEIEETQEAS